MKLKTKVRLAIRERFARLQKCWWESRERMLQQAYAALKTAQREHLASRQQVHLLEIDLEAAMLSLSAQKADPLSEAKKLLRLIEEILVPIYTRSGEVSNYELRCWMDDYRQFKKDAR